MAFPSRRAVMQDIGAGVRHYTGGATEAVERAGAALRKMRESFDRGFKGSAA